MAPKYQKAPVAEAVIDIRAAVGSGVSVEDFAGLVASLGDRFPSIVPMQNIQMGVEQRAGEETRLHTAHSITGHRLQTADESRVLQLRVDGFTYSWLSAYDTWDTFKNEAREIWRLFNKIAKHEVAHRVATRVINKIILPDSAPIELKKYFNLFPSIPNGLGRSLDTFFMQLQIRMDECTPGARAIVNFAGNEATDVSGPELVLDFDVFMESQAGFNEAEIWNNLDALRDCKNNLFESCITDELREIIA